MEAKVKKVHTDTAKSSKDGDGGEEDETNAAQDLEAVTLWIPIRPECHIVHCKTTNNNNNNKVFGSGAHLTVAPSPPISSHIIQGQGQGQG